MKIKTSDLSGTALDWAVAVSMGATDLRFDTVCCWWFTLDGKDKVLSRGWSAAQNWAPSVDWALGGPIIEREKIDIRNTFRTGGYRTAESVDAVHAAINLPNGATVFSPDKAVWEYGPTPLVAAMRCLVASKLGDEVEIPEGLL